MFIGLVSCSWVGGNGYTFLHACKIGHTLYRCMLLPKLGVWFESSGGDVQLSWLKKRPAGWFWSYWHMCWLNTIDANLLWRIPLESHCHLDLALYLQGWQCRHLDIFNIIQRLVHGNRVLTAHTVRLQVVWWDEFPLQAVSCVACIYTS